jgi:hypothetical protein
VSKSAMALPVVSALCAAVLSLPSPAAFARSSCIKGTAGPTTVVQLRDARGSIAAVATVTPCGPRSSMLDIVPRGRAFDGTITAIVRRGSCTKPVPLVNIQGDPRFMNPGGTATQFGSAAFAVELRRVADPLPVACGFHPGGSSLPATFLADNVESMKPVPGGYLASTARIRSARGGRATVITAQGGYGSSPTRVRLRPGTCHRIDPGQILVLWASAEGSPSKTTVNMPYQQIAKNYALEVLHDSGKSVIRCFDF